MAVAITNTNISNTTPTFDNQFTCKLWASDSPTQSGVEFKDTTTNQVMHFSFAHTSSTSVTYSTTIGASRIGVGTFQTTFYACKNTEGDTATGSTVVISDISNPLIGLFNIVKNNLGASFSDVKVTTRGYNASSSRPQVDVGWLSTPDDALVIGDRKRKRDARYYIDSYVTEAFGGDNSAKASHWRLDRKIESVIDENRNEPSGKIYWLQIINSYPLDEHTENKHLFRTRHVIKLLWFKNLGSIS